MKSAPTLLLLAALTFALVATLVGRGWSCREVSPEDQKPNNREGGVAQTLTLDISTSNDRYYTSDVVPLRVRLRNTSPRTAYIDDLLLLDLTLTAWIAPPGEEWRKAFYHPVGTYAPEEPRPMLPGQVKQETSYISFAQWNHETFLLPKPGIARVKVDYDDGYHHVTSNVLSLTLDASHSLPEFFRTRSWPLSILNGGPSKDLEERFANFLTSKDFVSQRHLLALMLGARYFSGELAVKLKPSKFAVRERNYAAAIKAYAVATEIDAPSLRAEAFLRLSNCYRAIGEPEAAGRAFRKCRREDLDTDLLPEYEHP